MGSTRGIWLIIACWRSKRTCGKECRYSLEFEKLPDTASKEVETSFYSQQELNSTNNLSDLRSEFFPKTSSETSDQPTPCFQACDVLNIEHRRACIDYNLENCELINGCFLEPLGLVICYVAIGNEYKYQGYNSLIEWVGEFSDSQFPRSVLNLLFLEYLLDFTSY